MHAAEIEYALGNLDRNRVFAWTPEDYRVSEVMQEYFANFVKSGNPNGSGLPVWPALSQEQVMRLDVESRAESVSGRERYRFLDRIYTTGAGM